MQKDVNYKNSDPLLAHGSTTSSSNTSALQRRPSSIGDSSVSPGGTVMFTILLPVLSYKVKPLS